ncbi:uncharacterized protein [Magallana gigas]|uniref:uncharacterized protein n=1 Tax=Magallana gigas TaxID=29159 RepID=UPI00333E708E
MANSMLLKLLCAVTFSVVGVSATFQMVDRKEMAPMVFHQTPYFQFKSGFGASFNEFVAPAPEPSFGIQAQVPVANSVGTGATTLNIAGPESFLNILGNKDNSLGVGASTLILPDPEPSIGNSGGKGGSFGMGGNTFRMPEVEPFVRNSHGKSDLSGIGGNTLSIPEPEPFSGTAGGKGGLFGRGDTTVNIGEPEPFGGNSGGISGSFGVSGNGIPEPEPFIGASGGKSGPFGLGIDAFSVPEPEPSGRNIAGGKGGIANDIFPFERNTFTGKKAYQPMLPGFPEVIIPDEFRDPCFHRVKAAFAKAYPSLPKLTEEITLIAVPMPRYVKDLPQYAYPTYSATGILYAPYRMPTTNYPLFVPFNASVEGKLELDRHPLLLPYPQLAASQPKYGREYPIYIPFSTKAVRAYPEHTSCGNDIWLPFQVGKKQFFRYRRFTLELPKVSSTIQNPNKLKGSALSALPSFTPISPIAPVILPVIPSFTPMIPTMTMPLVPMKYPSFIPPLKPMIPTIPMATKNDFGSTFGSPASIPLNSVSGGYTEFPSSSSISLNSGSGGYSGFPSPAGISLNSGSGGYSGFPSPAGISLNSGYGGYSGFDSPAGISLNSGSGGYSGFDSPAGISLNSGSAGYSGFPSPAGISVDSGSGGYSGFGSSAGISLDSISGGYMGFPSPAGISLNSGSGGYMGFSSPAGISLDLGSAGYAGSQWAMQSAPVLSSGSFVYNNVHGNNPAFTQLSLQSVAEPAAINIHPSGSFSTINSAGKGSSQTPTSTKKRGYY